MDPIDVDIHLQDDPNACGPACAEMLARVLTGRLEQQNAFVSTEPPHASWSTTPDQLADMINTHLPGNAPQYAVIIEDDQDDAIDRAAASVDHQGVRFPVAMLIAGGRHWEVVHGFTKGAGGNVEVHAKNPLPDRKLMLSLPLPLHADTDTCLVLNLQTGALEDEVVAMWKFKQDYFQRCDFAPEQWKDHYIVVAPERRRVRVRHKVAGIRPPRRHRVADAREASKKAWSALRDSGLLGLARWKRSMANLSPDAVYPAVRVQELTSDNAYYLVLITKADEGGALVAVDERSGRLVGAKLNPSNQLVASLAAAVNARVVWRPTNHSFFSPWFPFEQILRDGKTQFTRLFDGKTFDSLEPFAQY